MVSKNFLAKDDLKRALQITIGLPLLLAVCILGGCVAWPISGGDPGWLTITGIEGMDGKFVTSSSYLPPPAIPGILDFLGPKEVARSPAAVIINGEVKLHLYVAGSRYEEIDTVNVCLRIGQSAEGLAKRLGNTGFDHIFAEVRFNQGEMELNWADQVTPGYITIVNAPPEFAAGSATVYIGLPGHELKVSGTAYQGAEATCTVALSNRTGTQQPFFASPDGRFGNYRSYPKSGERDVIVVVRSSSGARSSARFEFKAAVIQNGTITLDLSRGVRQ
jgi:hypothetical protein